MPPTFLPGDIPATDASGAHFARDSYLTYYVDPYSLVPVVFHFHVEITDLNQCSPEVCDGVDNDCDGQIDEDFDTDSDTYTTCGEATNVRTNGLPGGGDCNDGNAGINPGATEFCNGVDEDCDIAIDEDFDADSDTHTTCGETTNVRTNGLPGGGDCNDSNAGINPGATESCNGVDEDCDISIDEDFDTDGDTYTTCGDFTNVRTNGLPGSKDCNDGKSAVHPGATEDCNGDDDDCDGSTDEGNPGGGLQCGGTEEGECSYGLTHCQDGQIHCVGAVGPSAEQCDVLDNDCDGSIDDGNPGGGASCDTGQPGVCSAGTTVCASGSVSCSQNVPPSAESCDTLDNDCDNVVDEGVCASTPLLTSLSPAKVWVGLQNAADAGLHFDLAAKVYLNDVEVGSGQLNSAPGGSSGFDNAKLDVIKLSLSAPVPVPPGSSFRIDLLVRNACRGSGRNSGEATLWYNGQPTDHGPREDAGSRFDARIGGTKRDYFLRESALLSTTAGTSRLSVDQDAGSPCSDFKSFGTWSTTLP